MHPHSITLHGLRLIGVKQQTRIDPCPVHDVFLHDGRPEDHVARVGGGSVPRGGFVDLPLPRFVTDGALIKECVEFVFPVHAICLDEI